MYFYLYFQIVDSTFDTDNKFINTLKLKIMRKKKINVADIEMPEDDTSLVTDYEVLGLTREEKDDYIGDVYLFYTLYGDRGVYYTLKKYLEFKGDLPIHIVFFFSFHLGNMRGMLDGSQEPTKTMMEMVRCSMLGKDRARLYNLVDTVKKKIAESQDRTESREQESAMIREIENLLNSLKISKP